MMVTENENHRENMWLETMAGDGGWDRMQQRWEEQMRSQVDGTMDVDEWVGEIITYKTRPEQTDKLLN